MPGALECIRAGDIPGGLKANREFTECLVGYDDAIDPDLKTLLYDPQTAGGLLISIASEHAENLIRDLQAAGVPARKIGDVTESQKPLIRIY